MNQIVIRENFDKIRVWKRKSSIAPHKPLLILLAIKYILIGKRWIKFRDILQEFDSLLGIYAPETKVAHPEYPFWRLQSDHIWEVHPQDCFEPNQSGDVSRRQLLEYDAYGGFNQCIAQAFIEDSSFALAIAKRLLEKYFEKRKRQQIVEKLKLKVL